jgi:DNA (cytosine-5)-methyltransferase 1
MKYLSVCSGIEAATVAWQGWQPVAFSEIEKFPGQVLSHHYPDVPNLGDMTNYKEWNIEKPDLLVGGTPCQSFSVAGLRKGLEDPRGNLALVYCGMLDHFRPQWFVWENVPGVLSSNGGRDFGSFLGAVAELGYGFAYRVLDAQFFGVAQRRRRVFVVGYLGDWRPPAAVLFERQSLRRDTAPSREKGQRVTECAGTLTANGGGLNRPAGNANELDFCVTVKKWPADTTCTLNAAFGNKLGLEDQHINGGASLFVPQPVTYDLYNVTAPVNGQRRNPGDPCHTLARANAEHAAVVSIQGNLIGREAGGPQGVGASDKDVMYTLTKADVHGVAQPIGFTRCDYGNDAVVDGTPTMRCGSNYSAHLAMAQSMAVRRLTPVECERLQGFPDNYTNIKENCPDGPRYKALGNSMAVPVMRWIGNRIEKHGKEGTEQ